MKLLQKLRALFRKQKLDAEMAEEMRLHLERRAEENVASGMSPDEAHYAALKKFGGVEQAKEIARDVRGWRWLDQLLQDVRYAMRALRKTPSFTITAVLTLAFGIGVNAALFTVFNAVALRSLPVRDPDGLVRIAGQDSKRGAYFPGFSYADYLDYRDSNHTLSGLVAVNEAVAGINGGAESNPLFEARGPGTLQVQFVSENYFEVLGAEFALGRGFTPEENRAPGIAPVMVISHLYWQRYFHSDPDVLGRTLALNGKIFSVIGVTAPEFSGQQPAPPACWIPLMMWGRADDYGPKGVTAFRLIGRLKPGVTEQQAKADLDVVAARRAELIDGFKRIDGFQRDSVRLERGLKFVNIPLNAKTLAALAPVLLGFGMVLVIACTNVANLLLARGVTRQAEIGVRLTLGAGRGRIIRQLLTENLLLCVLGAAVGLALAVWTLQVLQPIILRQLPSDWATETRRWRFLEVGPDWRVIGVTALLTVVAVLAAGLLPALHAGGMDLVSALKNEGTIFGRKLSQSRLRNFLVISQVAVCLMLLSCAGLLARNLFELRNVQVGFDPHALFLANARPKGSVAGQSDALRQTVETLSSLPGVIAASTAAEAPLLNRSGVTILAQTVGATGAEAFSGKINSFRVAADFFRTFGIPILRGRGFTRMEEEPGARVVIVSESAARRWWPGGVAIGQMLALGVSAMDAGGPKRAPEMIEYVVVGVARDVLTRVDNIDRSGVYLPFDSEFSMAKYTLFVRPRSDSPTALAETVRAADAAGLTLQFSKRLSDYLDEQMLPFYGLAVLSGALGGLALLMAAVGLYGVMAFGVNQRVREIGIRIALGATAKNVVGLFVRQGMRLIAVGIAVGLVGGALFALLLAKVLFGLGGAFDPVAFGGVTLIFSAVALLACWLPARRAAKVDPMVALRAE